MSACSGRRGTALRRLLPLRTSLLVLTALLLGACGDRGVAPLRVFAAASLTAAFQDVAAAFEREHPGVPVELHFAGTPQLVLQLREGAPGDVFASADEDNMRRAAQAGLVDGAAVAFAANRLTIVTTKGNPKAVRGLADLARDDLVVVLCGPEVPAGRYARQALAAAEVTVRSASDEPSVKAVVAKVQLGEADAGIVYTTDAAAARGAVDAVAIDDAHNVTASYPIAVLAGTPHAADARAFVAFVRSAEGQRLLARHGFVSP